MKKKVNQKPGVQNGNQLGIPPAAYKLKPAAEYLGGLSVPTMHRLIKRGLLRPCRGVRHLTFSLEELHRYLRDTMT